MNLELVGMYDPASGKATLNNSKLLFATPTNEPPHVWQRSLRESERRAGTVRLGVIVGVIGLAVVAAVIAGLI